MFSHAAGIKELISQPLPVNIGGNFNSEGFCHAADAFFAENQEPIDAARALIRAERPKQEHRQSNSQDYREQLSAAGKMGQQRQPWRLSSEFLHYPTRGSAVFIPALGRDKGGIPSPMLCSVLQKAAVSFAQ